MEIIPVLDLKGGAVVRARMGQRHLYAPIATPLAATSDPLDVARGLLAVYPFTTLYVADLDAIEGRGDNSAALRQINLGCPGVSLWVDNGIADAAAAARWLDTGLGSLVLGSETQADAALVRSLAADDRIILSLDFRGDAFQGPSTILDAPSAWPARVIAMTLARVGSGAGPDLERLAATQRIAAVPYLAYARKERRTQLRDPVNTRYVAQLLEAAGLDRLIALDVHNPAELSTKIWLGQKQSAVTPAY